MRQVNSVIDKDIHCYKSKVAQNEKKNYLGFLIPKILQILKHFSRQNFFYNSLLVHNLLLFTIDIYMIRLLVSGQNQTVFNNSMMQSPDYRRHQQGQNVFLVPLALIFFSKIKNMNPSFDFPV